MSLYGYIINRYDGEDSPKGDFAYDLQRDREITKEMKIDDYLLYTYLDNIIKDSDIKGILIKLLDEYLIALRNSGQKYFSKWEEKI